LRLFCTGPRTAKATEERYDPVPDCGARGLASFAVKGFDAS
jgi:hypothetical protein